MTAAHSAGLVEVRLHFKAIITLPDLYFLLLDFEISQIFILNFSGNSCIYLSIWTRVTALELYCLYMRPVGHMSSTVSLFR